jgi:hypothetical protein
VGWPTRLQKIALAVGAHVQACFDREAEVDQLITAETINDFAMIDAAYNPVQEM